MSNMELKYFDIEGRAFMIRVALHHAGIAFTDNRINFAQYKEQKAAGQIPVTGLPTLTIDGVVYNQSFAILRYAGKLANLYPHDPTQALIVDLVLDTAGEIFAK